MIGQSTENGFITIVSISQIMHTGILAESYGAPGL